MAQLRGGLFGCGMISEFHLRGWQRIPEVEIVALGNRTISRAEARRDQYVPGAGATPILPSCCGRSGLIS